jgi:hypothetical protein
VFAFRGAGAGGTGGVGAIGGELLRGNCIRHGNSTLRFEDGMEGGLGPKLRAASDGKERGCFAEKLSLKKAYSVGRRRNARRAETASAPPNRSKPF